MKAKVDGSQGQGGEAPIRLSVIIVSWNTRQILTDCLQSIRRHSPGEPFEVIVVDNASTDGTGDAILRDFRGVTLVTNETNRGFAAATNQGIARSRGEYLLLLNPDTIMHPRALDTLCTFMDHNPNAGGCGPRLLNIDGTVQPSARRFPSFRGALYRHTVFRSLRIFQRQYERWLMRDFSHDRQMDVDQLMGSALVLRRSAVAQVGPMDERFFMYYEEVDLCYRLRQAGWRIVLVPDATITHLGGQSAKQVPVTKRIMMVRSLLCYFRKHRGRFVTGAFNCVFKPAVIIRKLCDVVVEAVTYLLCLPTCDATRRRKSAVKVRDSTTLLLRYSWWLLFRA